ncbi:hypothetical protein LCGC14_1576790 [marine sediment metagenome]|uniref:Uncharacterized protein n=1 Tax=marine sediment metagenome TaxID=412755 RepID=A0A0F9II14_9ZZZZ
MKNEKAIRELLEENQWSTIDFCDVCANHKRKGHWPTCWISKALALLRQPEKSCQACGGSREVLQHCDECKAERGRHCKEPNCKVIPCPKCKQKEDVAGFDCISLREYLLSEKNRITRCLKREEKTHKEFLKRYNKDDYSGWIKRISIPEFEKELYWVNENIKALDIIESLNRSKEDVSEYREKLAELAHKQWSGWIKYMFGKCPGKADGTILIPEWAVTRWQRQACTPYSKLSHKEQESDRTEADKFIAIIESMEGK